MKKIKLLLPIFVLLALTLLGFKNNTVQSQGNLSPNDLASFNVHVHGEFGYGNVSGALVTLWDSKDNVVGTPRYTNSTGSTYCENGGYYFDEGDYTITAEKSGLSTGISYVHIYCCNNTDKNVNMGPAY